MSIKEQAIRLVESLPDNATWAEALERLQIAAALAKADDDIEGGQFATQEEAEAFIDECLRKSSGRSTA